ncbi:hypothetical protein [Paraburkholderia sp. SG-MS1]|uniref:hypothetical protein n=1 Tax=Paraburkholderia sp. SG-MS1 TaxID=2023741 RepID=UPI001448726D|nr:hypothetical protein [Paraburkholderia sp. SG-MS1]
MMRLVEQHRYLPVQSRCGHGPVKMIRPINDDGPDTDLQSPRYATGLDDIRHRVDLPGSELHLAGRPGDGFTLVACLQSQARCRSRACMPSVGGRQYINTSIRQ